MMYTLRTRDSLVLFPSTALMVISMVNQIGVNSGSTAAFVSPPGVCYQKVG